MKFKSRRATLHRRVTLGITTTFALGFTYTLYKALDWYQSMHQIPMVWGLMVIAPLMCGLLYYQLHKKYIRRSQIYKTEFPTAWRKILEQNVSFYQSLPPNSKERFEKGVQVFIAERKIQGVHTHVDDVTRVLVAASSVIPTFGYVDWEYDQLGTIFIYPNSFDHDFNFGNNAQRYIAGMVTNENMMNAMILSQKDIIDSFAYPLNGRNVPVHEFAHLVDKGDGAIDGDLSLYWNKKQSREWRSLMYHEMTRIWNGETFIDPYATTNPAEFLAVMSEYFFELPELLFHEHPEVYRLLKQGYRLDTRFLMADSKQAPFYHDLKRRIQLENEAKAQREAERLAQIQLELELESQRQAAYEFEQMMAREQALESTQDITREIPMNLQNATADVIVIKQTPPPTAAPIHTDNNPQTTERSTENTQAMTKDKVIKTNLTANPIPDSAPIKINYTLK